MDWLINWPEVYTIPDKRAQAVSKLILTKIFPRYGSPVRTVMNNRPENVNKVMRGTLESLNVEHLATSLYPTRVMPKWKGSTKHKKYIKKTNKGQYKELGLISIPSARSCEVFFIKVLTVLYDVWERRSVTHRLSLETTKKIHG